jgi:SagB-type dehydrogenase family enzyme
VLHDAGALIQNLVATANGLGMATNSRLRLNERNMHDLLGLSPETGYAEAEAVQGMVVWADDALKPLAAKPAGGLGRSEDLGVIPREPLAAKCAPYGSILAAHADCTAPGVAIRDIRPPLTELSPLPPGYPVIEMPLPPPPDGGKPMSHVLRHRKAAADFARVGIPRASLWTINRAAFRSGSHCPVYPAGPYVGLIRPLWLVNDVAGMGLGLWSYNPATDRWSILRRGDLRREAAYLSMEQPAWGNGSAVCFLVANLPLLMQHAGPDLYRLANLEAGVVAQRIQLAAAALGLGSCALGAFYDDEVVAFLNLPYPGWEPLHEVVIGVTPEDVANVKAAAEGIPLSFR